jgi:hypothetical protein
MAAMEFEQPNNIGAELELEYEASIGIGRMEAPSVRTQVEATNVACN